MQPHICASPSYKVLESNVQSVVVPWKLPHALDCTKVNEFHDVQQSLLSTTSSHTMHSMHSCPWLDHDACQARQHHRDLCIKTLINSSTHLMVAKRTSRSRHQWTSLCIFQTSWINVHSCTPSNYICSSRSNFRSSSSNFTTNSSRLPCSSNKLIRHISHLISKIKYRQMPHLICTSP